MENTGGILLRRTRLTETSLILTWLTKHYGRCKTVAKGALRPKSPFRGKLDLFYHCEILIAPSRTSELHALRDVKLIGAFEGLRRNYTSLLAAAYFVELVDESVESMEAVPEIYDLLLRALTYLDGEEPTLRAITFFESELATHLGIAVRDTHAVQVQRILVSHPTVRQSRQSLLDQLRA